MTECTQFPEGSRRRSICEGTADLPEGTLNALRERLGLAVTGVVSRVFRGGQIAERPPKKTSIKKPCNKCTPMANQQEGPGSELLKIYAAAGVPSCQQCKMLAKRMNNWGPECESRIEEIVEDIFPRAKAWVAAEKPWIHALLPGVVEDAGIRMRIKSDVWRAINAARANRDSAVNPPA